MSKDRPHIPPEVRILPMSPEEFESYGPSVEDVQQNYFLSELPLDKGGIYQYKKRGLNAPPGTVVLFQYAASVIASAVLRMTRSDPPDKEGYRDGLHFIVDSIQTFEPMDATALKRIWPAFTRFGQMKRTLDPKRYHAFERSLIRVELPALNPYQGEPDSEEPLLLETNIARRPVQKQIRERRGQTRFRNGLIERYGACCMVTGCGLLDVLEAAHIKTHSGADDNRLENGLLLRADIHTLFDLNLFAIEPDTLGLEIHPDIAKEYGDLVGKTLRCRGSHRPSPEVLRERHSFFHQSLKKRKNSRN